MARVNNLTAFLTDVATAIKTKKGDNTAISAVDFDTEIINLPSPGIYQNKQVNITTSGNYIITPDDTYDAMEQVVLNVEVAGKEDLDDVLNVQDQKITELEKVLENKAVGGKVKLNVFAQTTEPEEKDGIWFETDKKVEHYVSDDSIYFSGSWSNSGDTANIPYNFYQGAAVSIGENIYIFGGSDNSDIYKRAYKYDTLNNTYTRLTDIPYNFWDGAAVSIGENIYIFGGSGKSEYAYKYDTLTNAYTKLANIPFSFESGSAVVVGTDIYLLSGIWDKYVYKYNTLTNTYTRLADIPYGEFYNGAAIAVGTDIFMFGGNKNIKAVYKYDTLNNTYTRLTDMTYGFSYGAAVSVGTDIYLLGNGYSSNYYKYAYKYNTLTDIYTQLTNIPFNFYKGSATVVGTDIYIFGGSGNNTATRIYHIQTKTYNTDNTVIIAQGRAGIGKTYNSGYAVELFDTTFDENFQPLYGLVDAWFYTITDGVITTIPTYYGDGTQWIKFKN